MKNIITGIYKITCTINNKFYIGSSKNITNRWRFHIYDLKKNRHVSTYMQNSFNKYGLDTFRFEIIEECNILDLLDREQYYLDTLAPYNSNIGFNTSISSRPGLRKEELKKSTITLRKETLKSNAKRKGIKKEGRELPVSIYFKNNKYLVALFRSIKEEKARHFNLGSYCTLKEAEQIYDFFNSLDEESFLIEYKKYRQNKDKNKKDKCTSKYPNVSFKKKINKWQAAKYVNGKSTYIGVYETQEEAYKAVLEFVKNNNLKL